LAEKVQEAYAFIAQCVASRLLCAINLYLLLQ
jgi:hypothetical protein